MTDRDDEADPLLVRPYLRDEPGGTTPPASGQTWPEAAAEPVAAPAPGAAVPAAVPAPPQSGLRRHRTLLMLAVVLVAVVAGAAALVSALLPESGTRTALPLDIPLPSVPVTEPVPAPTGTEPPPAARTAPTTAPSTRGTSRPTGTTAPAPTPGRTSPTTAPAPTTTSPATDRLAPPAADRVDRVGRIHGLGGLCLDLNGAIAVEGNHIQVFTCNDSAAQVWTMATDGTLRVVGRCAAAADDGAVRITGCDGRRSARWQTGADGTLVNAAGRGCLTDPGAGTRSAAGVRVESCSGADRQRWKLP